MDVRKETLENVKVALKGFDIKSNIIENKFVKKSEPVISIFNSDYYIQVKEHKKRPNIYFLYRYDENSDVKNVWLMGSIDILDVIKKLKELI